MNQRGELQRQAETGEPGAQLALARDLLSAKDASQEQFHRAVDLIETASAAGDADATEMRAVFEALGVGDVVSKSLGTSNPYNMVRATFDALKNQQSPRMVAQRRGRSVAEILARREDQTAEA